MHQEKMQKKLKFDYFITVKEQSPVLIKYMKCFNAPTKFLLGLRPYSLWCQMKYEVNLMLLISYFWKTTLRPNLKNLSHGLNLSCGSNLIVPLKFVLNFSIFKPVHNWNHFFEDVRHGFNSLNLDAGYIYFESDISLRIDWTC